MVVRLDSHRALYRALLYLNPGDFDHDLVRLHLAHAFRATVLCVPPTPCAYRLHDHCLAPGNFFQRVRVLPILYVGHHLKSVVGFGEMIL